MANIIGSLPYILVNGTTADATQVMADFNFIIGQTNANALPATGPATITGNLTVTGPISTSQQDGVTISVVAGQTARYLSQVAGHDQWAAGSDASGNYTITDLTGPLTALSITPAGAVTLNADPTVPLGAVTKQYVDSFAGHNIGRNLLHNSMFNIQQRGTGPWAGIQYTLDRWLIAVTTDTSSVAVATFADSDRTAIGDEAARSGGTVSFTGNAAAGANTRFIQNVESVRRLGGKTVTVSFYAVASVGGLKLGANIGQVFGTGGSPSASVYSAGQAVILTTAWTRYYLTFVIPSTSGQTLGTNNNDYTSLAFWFSSGATNAGQAGNIGVQSGTINLWGVQLEVGSVMTPLEKIDPGEDIRRCQRFFIGNGLAYMYTYSAAGSPFGVPITFPVGMRAVPTIAFSAPSYTNASGLAAGLVGQSNCIVYATAIALGQANFNATFTASADL